MLYYPRTNQKNIMAPNKRADNKKGVTLYVDKKILERFQNACEFFGLAMSVVLTSYMETKANEYEQLLRDRDKAATDRNSN